MSLQANELLILKRFNDQVNAATAQAVTEAMKNASELASVIVDAVSEKVSAISAPVLKVQIKDKEEIKLSKPASKYLEPALKILMAGCNLYLHGPAGSGKTTLAYQIAEVFEQEIVGLIATKDMGKFDYFGSMNSRDGSTYYIDAAPVLAAKEGKVLFIDEFDMAPDYANKSLNALGDSQRILRNPVSKENIVKHEKFKFIVGGNTIGLGSDGVYGGSRQDASVLSRFVPLYVGYDQELEKALASAYAQDGKLLNRIWEAREALTKKKAKQIVSTRQIETAHRLVYVAGFSENEALHKAFSVDAWPAGLAESVGF
jgi:MoxR-like ATPase